MKKLSTCISYRPADRRIPSGIRVSPTGGACILYGSYPYSTLYIHNLLLVPGIVDYGDKSLPMGKEEAERGEIAW